MSSQTPKAPDTISPNEQMKRRVQQGREHFAPLVYESSRRPPSVCHRQSLEAIVTCPSVEPEQVRPNRRRGHSLISTSYPRNQLPHHKSHKFLLPVYPEICVRS